MQDDAAARRLLETLPNVGPATARDLLRLGIRAPPQLRGKGPQALYRRLCRLVGRRVDPCMLDVMMALVDHANGAPPRPWWRYTGERKRRFPDL